MTGSELTAVQTTGTAPGWLRELYIARVRYEETLGWPVDVDVTHRQLTIAAGEWLDAITMPSGLAALVHREVRVATGSAGPVMSSPGRRWWTLLTSPCPRGNDRHVPVASHRAGIRTLPRRGRLVIPTGLTDVVEGPGDWHWIQRPQAYRPLPTWSQVLDATTEVLRRNTVAPAC
jgi:hypothetical protein